MKKTTTNPMYPSYKLTNLVNYLNESGTGTLSQTFMPTYLNETIKMSCHDLLKKEKEQIQNVFEHCWNHPNWKGEYDIKDMNDYLKNYNQNK